MGFKYPQKIAAVMQRMQLAPGKNQQGAGFLGGGPSAIPLNVLKAYGGSPSGSPMGGSPMGGSNSQPPGKLRLF